MDLKQSISTISVYKVLVLSASQSKTDNVNPDASLNIEIK